jgi:hypothetical protein
MSEVYALRLATGGAPSAVSYHAAHTTATASQAQVTVNPKK